MWEGLAFAPLPRPRVFRNEPNRFPAHADGAGDAAGYANANCDGDESKREWPAGARPHQSADGGAIAVRGRSRPELSDARRQGYYNIGEVAELSGVSAKMIRRYECIGLIPEAGRTFAGYRIYSSSDVHLLRFIKRARALGFSIKQIEALLGLRSNRSCTGSEVKELVQAHANRVSARIREMQAIERILLDLASRCHASDHRECPILEDLATVPGGSIVDGPWRN